MKAIEVLEERKSLLVTGIVLICVAALLVTARRFNVTLDIYWHIQTGIDWITKGWSPWIDHYSFTFYGEEIKSQPYLFQLLVGFLVLNFGVETGLEIFRMASFLLVVILVLVFLRRLNSSAIVYLLVIPVLTLLLQQRSVSRPEILSYSLIVIAVMLYYGARSRMSAASMIPIVLLMWLWNNYHSSIFGYIIFFGLFADTGLRYLQERKGFNCWLRWLGWGVAVVAIGSLRPGFGIPLLGLFTFSSEWKDLIMEYVSLKTKINASSFTFSLGILSFGIIGLATLILVAWKRYIGLLFICVLLIYFATEMSRLVTPVGIVLVCVFAWMMNEVRDDPRFTSFSLASLISVGTLGLYVFAICMYSVVVIARENMTLNRTFSTGFPQDVADYMIEEGISGRIFNEYQDGGYLIYRLSPESKVYIDGRSNILYPVEHVKLQLEAKAIPAVLVEEVEKHDIDLVLLENSKANFSLVEDTGEFELEFMGFEHALYRRSDARIPATGKFFANPACWTEKLSSLLRSEYNLAQSYLPERSPALEYLDFALSYADSNDRKTFLSGLSNYKDWDDYKLRFTGFQALNAGLYEQSFELFSGIKRKDFADFLGGALAKAEVGDWRAVESVLDYLTKINWSSVKQSDLQILYQLLSLIELNDQFQIFDREYVNGLKNQFMHVAMPSEMPGVESFCTEF